jgi:TolA-binding protein
MPGKDLLSRLADAGEEAISRLSKVPGGDQVVHAMNTMRERTDELQKRVRGIEQLESRVEELEQRVAALEGGKRSPARQAASASGRTSTSRSRSRSTASKSSRSASARGSSSEGSSAPTGGDSPG